MHKEEIMDDEWSVASDLYAIVTSHMEARSEEMMGNRNQNEIRILDILIRKLNDTRKEAIQRGTYHRSTVGDAASDK